MPVASVPLGISKRGCADVNERASGPPRTVSEYGPDAGGRGQRTVMSGMCVWYMTR